MLRQDESRMNNQAKAETGSTIDAIEELTDREAGVSKSRGQPYHGYSFPPPINLVKLRRK